MRTLILLTVTLFYSLTVAAEVVVLIQGYHGEDDPWRRSGVAATLASAGWRDAGHLHRSPTGVSSTRPTVPSPRSFYTVELPTEAPLLVQLRHLEPLIGQVLRAHSHQSLTLVGHSAGGVLARLYMVHHPADPIVSLITIAAPHLGTVLAELGNTIGQSPLGWITPLVGASTINRSQGLYFDLNRENPASLLFWLNRQPHPAAHYVSVVRNEGGSIIGGDLTVAPWSQDMNRVTALIGRSQLVVAGLSHRLIPADGPLLVRLLSAQQSL